MCFFFNNISGTDNYFFEKLKKERDAKNEKRKNNKIIYNVTDKCLNCTFCIILSKF